MNWKKIRNTLGCVNGVNSIVCIPLWIIDLHSSFWRDLEGVVVVERALANIPSSSVIHCCSEFTLIVSKTLVEVYIWIE